ncbi:peptidase S8 and S53 subtilisin kexin sedolisin [Pseudopedobacter saltans DSM 12145]|uniref:Peptidase S8 and S53 subtilisin kexin sedolisin n=1 Tax=Pseudopedobacter saltans (strain ATCC 51119 / DSM 12145 / JCM 21818 / CCUG 39354 / LMG 10337 / NBRC 100064 / NCIMB 13643) TaxID=762903 RepID=F0S520_PSESL|nr:S8 family peptidase [Pseudopedobacter saltans]ADY50937.1 peptidase S8 and S53 subtilisin kexin sedolisin [Pseudopedobacter saltans DSM 12145]
MKRITFITKSIFILAILFFIPVLLMAQKANWQNLDLHKDGVFGISAEKAYDELLKGKTGVKVKVAVLDSGVDIDHEDLSAVIWKNPSEEKNGKDDDGNGYVDDVYGWNFLGSSIGNVNYDNLELTRLVRCYDEKFGGRDSAEIKISEQKDYEIYKDLKNKLTDKKLDTFKELVSIGAVKNTLDSLVEIIGKDNPRSKDFKRLKLNDFSQEYLVSFLIHELKKEPYSSLYYNMFGETMRYYKEQLQYHLNEQFNSRDTVGDNYKNVEERIYGNSDVVGPDALHGTHVAGIIAATRNNKKGINGVADNVEIISVRCVPNGDERDKDVANSIRYAVDKGAKIINMSFGKSYSTNKKAVDEAVKYAMSKDVLLVHAAGNDNKNLEQEANFPNRLYESGGSAVAWLEVGASSWKADSTLKAPFSNYGKTKVDVFAPGAAINSTVPGSKYQVQSGTSMAAPVVSGAAAILRSYYPNLTAVQVKEVIMKSAIPFNGEVVVDNGEKIRFSDLSVSGGIVNIYEALKLASTY